MTGNNLRTNIHYVLALVGLLFGFGAYAQKVEKVIHLPEDSVIGLKTPLEIKAGKYYTQVGAVTLSQEIVEYEVPKLVNGVPIANPEPHELVKIKVEENTELHCELLHASSNKARILDTNQSPLSTVIVKARETVKISPPPDFPWGGIKLLDWGTAFIDIYLKTPAKSRFIIECIEVIRRKYPEGYESRNGVFNVGKAHNILLSDLERIVDVTPAEPEIIQ